MNLENKSRFEVLVDGKWQGGTFKTQNEAEAHAATLKKTSEGKSVTVRQRKDPLQDAQPDAPPAHVVPAAPIAYSTGTLGKGDRISK